MMLLQVQRTRSTSEEHDEGNGTITTLRLSTLVEDARYASADRTDRNRETARPPLTHEVIVFKYATGRKRRTPDILLALRS